VRKRKRNLWTYVTGRREVGEPKPVDQKKPKRKPATLRGWELELGRCPRAPRNLDLASLTGDFHLWDPV